MQQIGQNRDQTAKLQQEQETERQHHRHTRQNAPRMAAMALRAVQAGVPLTGIPPAWVMALSGQIGNDALAGLLEQKREPFEAVIPPAAAVRTDPFVIQAGEPAASAPPDWSAMPVLQQSGASGQGGDSLA